MPRVSAMSETTTTHADTHAAAPGSANRARRPKPVPRPGRPPEPRGPGRIIDRMLADGVDLADVAAVRAWLDALIQHTVRPAPADPLSARHRSPTPSDPPLTSTT